MLRTEFEKIKKMSPADALSYIWEYYKLWILGTAFVLIFGISLVSAIAENKKTDPVVRVGIQNDMELLCGDELDALLSEAFPQDTGYTAPLKLNFSSVASKNDPYAVVQIATWLGAGEIDCLICDEPTRDYFAQDPESFSFTDISDTTPGKLSRENGVGSLYYVIVKNAKHAREAETFLEAVRAF